jgi:hypothetical protein
LFEVSNVEFVSHGRFRDGKLGKPRLELIARRHGSPPGHSAGCHVLDSISRLSISAYVLVAGVREYHCDNFLTELEVGRMSED